MLFNILSSITKNLHGKPHISMSTSVRSRPRGPSSNRTFLNYFLAFGITMVGFGYGNVPLYRLYCSTTGRGTNASDARAADAKIQGLKPIKNRKVQILFSADTHSNMTWNFKPLQREITIVPGETALAFYSAENPTDNPVVGIATYSIIPVEASKYFNKVQCFCFEEQRLNPHEQVDLPVFFFLDPEFDNDPRMAYVDRVVLHYTFFQAKRDRLYVPGITSTDSSSSSSSETQVA